MHLGEGFGCAVHDSMEGKALQPLQRIESAKCRTEHLLDELASRVSSAIEKATEHPAAHQQLSVQLYAPAPRDDNVAAGKVCDVTMRSPAVAVHIVVHIVSAEHTRLQLGSMKQGKAAKPLARGSDTSSPPTCSSEARASPPGKRSGRCRTWT
ncbi:hypothetical protein VOLCADRAFT_98362 [Volvox carteri f. nagariensis]|uniref:Uncharacterized protein n=1 Tax=Volvox carteri f. nagariensis TaxID=3068 RepID=D8UF53_VOLCA|nr:uncharacterized protein VOLCADRAFT_98362 [Volvox carteri f. nagariensis]EFJ41657.1 hypothetical protein VOLCADRAFT_98362 [Volvox carteri f. nagariensis]|eukprot:XP_002957313.1 hypothetical protein VOLCADRAFT_98362 [Volvox carteri f. nagariensis]